MKLSYKIGQIWRVRRNPVDYYYIILSENSQSYAYAEHKVKVSIPEFKARWRYSSNAELVTNIFCEES